MADADLFFYYLRGGRLEEQAADVIGRAAAGSMSIRASSEVYDDAVTALRSEGQPPAVARDFVEAMRSIPHTPVAVSAQTAADALAMYEEFGGRGRLSYFDSFHVATARSLGIGIVTSDGYINKNARRLGVRAIDLSEWPALKRRPSR